MTRLGAAPVNNLRVEDEESKANDRSLPRTEHDSTNGRGWAFTFLVYLYTNIQLR